jgi:pilus assembly protein FimV
LATDLHGQTGGAGPDWEKAAALGRSIDPENALYGGKSEVPAEEHLSPLPDLSATTVIIPPAEPVADKLRDTVTLPGQLAQMATDAETPPESPVLDFDLDLGTPAPAPEELVADSTPLDFDLDLDSPAPVVEAVEPAPMPAPTHAPLRPDEMTHLNLDLAGGTSDMVAVERDEPTHINVDFDLPDSGTTSAPQDAAGLDFEFDLGLDVPAEEHAPAQSSAMHVDLGATSLNLGPATEPPGEAGDGDDNPDVTTKLELAQAYEEMGDKEGARELLQEVVNEGSVRQQEAARAKLATLDA